MNCYLHINHNSPRSYISPTSTQGSFPAGTPGNGIPKVILTVGTAFPGNAIVR